MKKRMDLLLLSSIFSLNIFCSNHRNNQSITANEGLHEQAQAGLLSHTNSKAKDTFIHAEQEEPRYYQDTIDSWIADMYIKKKGDFLNEKIKHIEADNQIPALYKAYWSSYLLYNKSVFYKKVLNDDTQAELAIDLAIQKLEKNAKTSEDFSLLAACTSFSIQFANMTQLASISEKVNELAEKSIQINNKNIRAYYVLASQNYHTPKMFGGGTRVEEYALKGLACPDKLIEDSYAPAWGRNALLSILIRYYESEKRFEEVEKYKTLIKKEN